MIRGLITILIIASSTIFSNAQTDSETFRIDKGINNIFLENAASLEKTMGKKIWNKHFEANGMFPRIECLNKKGDQLLRLFFFYGGSENCVAEFELFYVPNGYKKPNKILLTKIKDFKSVNNISLGMSKKSVINIIGKQYTSKRIKSEEEITFYTNDTSKGILKELGGVAYFIKCMFRKNILINYSFGFEYP